MDGAVADTRDHVVLDAVVVSVGAGRACGVVSIASARGGSRRASGVSVYCLEPVVRRVARFRIPGH